MTALGRVECSERASGPDCREAPDRLPQAQTRRGSRSTARLGAASVRSLFTVQGFASDAAPVAVGDRDELGRAKYAAFTGAVQLRGAMFGKDACLVRRDT